MQPQCIYRMPMTESDAPSFGIWLKSRRRALDVTQKELARQVECAEITIRKIEANHLRPSKKLTSKLVSVLQVPQAEIDSIVGLARRIGHSA
jgi:DNA-binding XRE family transcriptional regulator